MLNLCTNISLIPTNIINKLALTEIRNCNDITCRFGLELTEKEALELVDTRNEALKSTGRIEFAGGVIKKIIIEFCDSPYISHHNYVSSLNDLIETFYYFKNETIDEISDDELISIMHTYFDHNCQGCIELLQNRELETLAHNIRFGIKDYNNLGEDKFDFCYEEEYYE